MCNFFKKILESWYLKLIEIFINRSLTLTQYEDTVLSEKDLSSLLPPQPLQFRDLLGCNSQSQPQSQPQSTKRKNTNTENSSKRFKTGFDSYSRVDSSVYTKAIGEFSQWCYSCFRMLQLIVPRAIERCGIEGGAKIANHSGLTYKIERWNEIPHSSLSSLIKSIYYSSFDFEKEQKSETKTDENLTLEHEDWEGWDEESTNTPLISSATPFLTPFASPSTLVGHSIPVAPLPPRKMISPLSRLAELKSRKLNNANPEYGWIHEIVLITFSLPESVQYNAILRFDLLKSLVVYISSKGEVMREMMREMTHNDEHSILHPMKQLSLMSRESMR